MVKNTAGGKHKNQARKFLNAPSSSRIRLSTHPDECYALVTKMSGNGMCRVDIAHNNSIISDICCHIRGKFRSRNKKQNLVSVNSIVLVGLRAWESDTKSCDLVCIYLDSELSSLPSLPFSNSLSNDPILDDDDLFSPPPHSFTSLPLNHIITTIDHHLDNHLDLDLDLDLV